jgi:hypothetical protein
MNRAQQIVMERFALNCVASHLAPIEAPDDENRHTV